MFCFKLIKFNGQSILLKDSLFALQITYHENTHNDYVTLSTQHLNVERVRTSESASARAIELFLLHVNSWDYSSGEIKKVNNLTDTLII